MLHMFINHVYGIANLRKSRIAGQIGFCSVPGRAPLLGGGVLGVSRSSRNPEAALEFIRWACSEHIALPFTMLGGISPCSCVYDNPDILDLYPWLSIVPQNLSLARVRSVPAGVSEYAVEVVIGTAVQNLLKGRCTPEGALDETLYSSCIDGVEHVYYWRTAVHALDDTPIAVTVIKVEKIG